MEKGQDARRPNLDTSALRLLGTFDPPKVMVKLTKDSAIDRTLRMVALPVDLMLAA